MVQTQEQVRLTKQICKNFQKYRKLYFSFKYQFVYQAAELYLQHYHGNYENEKDAF